MRASIWIYRNCSLCDAPLLCPRSPAPRAAPLCGCVRALSWSRAISQIDRGFWHEKCGHGKCVEWVQAENGWHLCMVECDGTPVVPSVEAAVSCGCSMKWGPKQGRPKVSEGRLGRVSQRRVVQIVIWQGAGHFDGGEGGQGKSKNQKIRVSFKKKAQTRQRPRVHRH